MPWNLPGISSPLPAGSEVTRWRAAGQCDLVKKCGSALAYLEYLVYNCGYTQADLNTYFSERNFKEVIFRDYQNLQRKAQCADDEAKLTLHEFTASGKQRIITFATG